MYTAKGFMDWTMDMIDSGLLREKKSEDMLTHVNLVPPIRIRLTDNAAEKLKRDFMVNEEVGGLLLGDLVMDDEGKRMDIVDVIFVPNVADEKDRCYVRQEARWGSAYVKGMKNNKYRGLFPCPFHSHPLHSFHYKDDLNCDIIEYTRRYYRVCDPSGHDQTIIDNIQVGLTLITPPRMVYTYSDKLNRMFMCFYGGGIAPWNIRNVKNTRYMRSIYDGLKKVISFGAARDMSLLEYVSSVDALVFLGAVGMLRESSFEHASGHPDTLIRAVVAELSAAEEKPVFYAQFNGDDYRDIYFPRRRKKNV